MKVRCICQHRMTEYQVILLSLYRNPNRTLLDSMAYLRAFFLRDSLRNRSRNPDLLRIGLSLWISSSRSRRPDLEMSTAHTNVHRTHAGLFLGTSPLLTASLNSIAVSIWLDFGRFGQARHATFGILLAIVHVITYRYMYHVHVKKVGTKFEIESMCSDWCLGSKVGRISRASAHSLPVGECEKLCSVLMTRQGHA